MTDFRKVLVVSSGLHGMTNSCLALSKRLLREGHECILLCSMDLSLRCKKEGVHFIQIKNIDSKYFSKLKTSRLQSILKRKSIYDNYFERFAGNDFAELITRLDASIVLIDMEMHEHILSLHENGISFCLLSQWYSIWPGMNFPPPSSLTIPDKASAAEISKQWIKEKKKRAPSTKKRIYSWLKPNRRSAILYLVNKLAIPEEDWVSDIWPTPLVYNNMEILSFTIKEFDFVGSSAEKLTYIGPQVDVNRYEDLSDVDMAKITQIQEAAKEKLIVLLTKTSMTAEASCFYDDLLQFLKTRSDCLIVTKGDNAAEQAHNLVTFDWLPQLKVLKLADVCINHGGIHTINECFSTATPMIIYPGGSHDQNGCLARMKNLDLDVILTQEVLDTERITKFLHKCRTESFSSNYTSTSEITSKYEQIPLSVTLSKALAV